MHTVKQVRETLSKIDKRCFDLSREELAYRKVLSSLACSTLIPPELKVKALELIKEDIPFSLVQARIKQTCDEWLDGFKCEADVNTIEAVYQLRSLFSKIPFEGNDEECTAAAIATLLQGERDCRETNERFSECFQQNGKWIDLSVLPLDKRELVSRVRKEVDTLMGPFTADTLEKIITRANEFGPGQTIEQRIDVGNSRYDSSSLDKQKCSAPHKMSRVLFVTQDAEMFVKPILRSNHSWLKSMYTTLLGESHAFWWDSVACSMQILWDSESVVREVHNNMLRIFNANMVSFVPKNSDTHRSISIENTFNGAMQKSAGTHLKHSLHKNGVNLYDQSINQGLAVRGSHDNSVATIDLKNASCTLACNTVRLLTQWEWFTFLSRLRSKEGILHSPSLGYDNFKIEYEQFSSMGNGFTFELESAIFAGIARAVVKLGSGKLDLVSVYGDDIIVPREDALAVIEALSYFGFTTNKDKTFIDGPFRESCGVDAYKGKNIRPVVFKRRLQSEVDLWFFMNRIAYQCLSRGSLLLQGCYDVLGSFLDQDKIIPGPLTFAFKADEEREGKYSLDTDDLESGLKIPLSRALDYSTRVMFCRTGRIKYFRLRVKQNNDQDWHFDLKSLKRMNDNQKNGYVSLLGTEGLGWSILSNERYSTTLQHCAGLYGYRQGEVPLRGNSTRSVKETISLAWESYPADVVRRYFP